MGDAVDRADVIQKTISLFRRICPRLRDQSIRQLNDREALDLIHGAADELRQRGSTFTDLFRRVERSDYLIGAKGNFRAGLWWILERRTVHKILNGNYDDFECVAGHVPVEEIRRAVEAYRLAAQKRKDGADGAGRTERQDPADTGRHRDGQAGAV